MGTWNAKTLFDAEKLDNVIENMNKMEANIFGVIEDRWPGNGMLRSKDKILYYSGTSDWPNGR